MCLTFKSAVPQFSGNFVAKFKLVTPVGRIGDPNYKPDTPDILVTQLHIQPVLGIMDLAWAFDPGHDMQIGSQNNIFDELFKMYFTSNYIFYNIFDKAIS